MLVGVDDNGKAVGIEQDYPFVRHGNRDGWELWLTDIVSKSVSQVAVTDMDVRYAVIDGKTVACIGVKPGAKPVFAKKTLRGETQEVFFARLNNSTRELTGQALLDYHKKQWPA